MKLVWISKLTHGTVLLALLACMTWAVLTAKKEKDMHHG